MAVLISRESKIICQGFTGGSRRPGHGCLALSMGGRVPLSSGARGA